MTTTSMRHSGTRDMITATRQWGIVLAAIGFGLVVGARNAHAIDSEIKLMERGYLSGSADADTYVVSLTAGEAYFFTAVYLGDEDDRDFDIYVSGPDGQTVSKDTGPDSAPAVVFVAEASGRHSIRIVSYRGAGQYMLSQVMAGIMAGSGDTDTYRLNLHSTSAGRSLMLTTLTNGLKLRITLCDDSGDEIDTYLFEGDDVLLISCPTKPGAYQLEITSRGGSGDYLLVPAP